MPVLWQHLAQNESFASFSLVRDTAEQLHRVSFADAFSAAAEQAEREGLVLPPTRQLLLEFGAGCGHTDLAGQQSHIDYYRRLLAAQETECRRVWQEKGRVYRVLGLTGGIALMLLLM